MDAPNGVNGHHAQADEAPLDLSTIIQALHAVHDPASTNEQRRLATEYLDNLKQRNDISTAGFTLASDTTQQALVRHYGLALLEHVIKRQSLTLDQQSSLKLRQMVIQLSLDLDHMPEIFLRNKTASLWVELAKRFWGLDWLDLDATLQQLWQQSDAAKEFVLAFLENISDDVFVREDATAALRENDLNKAVVEIVTAYANYHGGLTVGGQTHQLRHGLDGWMARIINLLRERLPQAESDRSASRLCVSILNVVRSLFSWLMTPAIVSAGSMTVVCNAMTQGGPELTLSAIDALLVFYSRKKLELIDVEALVHPLCHPASVDVLSKVYHWSIVGPDDTLDPRYAISKKLAELLYHLASWLASSEPPGDTNLTPFFELLVQVARHDSLIVSIAAIHSWHKLLELSEKWRSSDAVKASIESILKVAMERVIAYDAFPTDTEEPAVVFVNEEIELHPERQGFYLNYRKLCFGVIESISASYLQQAASFTLSSADTAFAEIEALDRAQDASNYERLSKLMLRADAQYSVVDATYKGINKFTSSHSEDESEEISRQLHELLVNCKSWIMSHLEKHRFRDPGITLRQMRSIVDISGRLLSHDNEFAFTVLEHILMVLRVPPTSDRSLLEAYQDLHQAAVLEMKKMCADHATYLISFYDQLEGNLSDVIHHLDQKHQVDMKAALMLLVEHADGLSLDDRAGKLQTFIHPLQDAWTQQAVVLRDFDSFVSFQAFDRVGPLMAKLNVNKDADWTQVPLSAEAKSIQDVMASNSSRIPLRETRVLLSVSMDKVYVGTEKHQLMCEIWRPLINAIIENVMQITVHSHHLHDVSLWPNVSEYQREVIRRVLRDRYWQSGISACSMQDFQQKVRMTQQTLEGFASSVRGRIRTNLENCYSILHTLGKLGSAFYGMSAVPELVTTSLLSSAYALSPHHFGVLLSMVPKLIEECPREDMMHFLTPFLAELTRQMDNKCTKEWEKVHARSNGETQPEQDENGDLSNEMRDESVLRQMTSRAVSLVCSWLNPDKEGKQVAKRISNRRGHDLRTFVLSNRTVLEPLLLFCCHAISFRDMRTCNMMINTLQKLVPAFVTEKYLQGNNAAAVREFISSTMLKSAITCINDGYFADYHHHIAELIAVIWTSYGLPTQISTAEGQPDQRRQALTETPQMVLLSIPGLHQADVARAQQRLSGLPSTKRMRATVLELLESIRGVRVSELGKYDDRHERSSLLERYKQRDALNAQSAEEANGSTGNGVTDDSALRGIAEMFG